MLRGDSVVGDWAAQYFPLDDSNRCEGFTMPGLPTLYLSQDVSLIALLALWVERVHRTSHHPQAPGCLIVSRARPPKIMEVRGRRQAGISRC